MPVMDYVPIMGHLYSQIKQNNYIAHSKVTKVASDWSKFNQSPVALATHEYDM